VLSFVLGLSALLVLAACGNDDTSAPADLESISYLLQGLLTTDQIGGGWVDQGRQVIPPGSEQLTGFLCPQGEAAVAGLEGRLDPQVSTSFRRSTDVGVSVFQTLMWGDRDQVVSDFAAFAAAVRSCAGAGYSTADLGDLSLAVDESPALGTAAVAFRFAPTSPSDDNPSLQQRSTAVLLSDPGQPVALVVGVGVTTVRDPASAAVTEVDPAEYTHIVEAAVDRILEGL